MYVGSIHTKALVIVTSWSLESLAFCNLCIRKACGGEANQERERESEIERGRERKSYDRGKELNQNGLPDKQEAMAVLSKLWGQVNKLKGTECAYVTTKVYNYNRFVYFLQDFLERQQLLCVRHACIFNLLIPEREREREIESVCKREGGKRGKAQNAVIDGFVFSHGWVLSNTIPLQC